MKLFGYGIRIELFLAMIYFIVPFFLPFFHQGFMPSLSEYHYTSQRYSFIILLGIIGVLTVLDGFNNTSRRFNIWIGFFMIGVVSFPVLDFRALHNTLAILFFVGNAYVVTRVSKILSVYKKKIFTTLIAVTLLLFLLGFISLYVAESIGMFSMSYYMFIRYRIIEKRQKSLDR